MVQFEKKYRCTTLVKNGSLMFSFSTFSCSRKFRSIICVFVGKSNDIQTIASYVSVHVWQLTVFFLFFLYGTFHYKNFMQLEQHTYKDEKNWPQTKRSSLELLRCDAPVFHPPAAKK